MVNKTPLVSIVILNWNGIEDTKLCLEYVRKLKYKNFEVIVVDNGSSAEEKKYLSKLTDIIYVDNPKNRGFAGGQTDGYKVARGDFILLLNNDAVIKNDYLEKAIPLFEDKDVAVVGGRSYFWNEDSPLMEESNQFYSFMEVNPLTGETNLQLQDEGIIQEVNTVSGSSVLIRRSAVDKVGYLYEYLFAYYEETDLFARVKRAGYKILYSPSLHIWHKNGASSGAQGGSSFFYYHIFRNRFIYAFRNFENPFLRSFLKNYYVSWLKSLLGVFSSTNSRRLALAYTKAVLINTIRLPFIIRDRLRLEAELGKSTYCRSIVKEQVKISFVIDATTAQTKALKIQIKEAQNDPNPYHEYIYVVSDKTSSNLLVDSRQVRTVINKGYFDTHPINIGGLAARMEWIVVVDDDPSVDPSNLRSKVSMLKYSKHKVAYFEKFIVIRQDYFQQVGGMHWSTSDLKSNFLSMKSYAFIDHTLSPISHNVEKAKVSKEIRHEIAYNKSLAKAQGHTAWRKFILRHYRFQQIDSLVRWLFHLRIPIRLKVGRSKNIILYALTLKRKRLALELRHTRNELQIYSKENGALVVWSDQKKRLPGLTRAAQLDPSNIPVFIICFERVDALEQLVSWLEEIGMKKIIFIDNDSSYPKLLEYYQKTDYQVLRLYRNSGHKSPWSQGIIRTLIPNQYYIVTDPDVIPVQECPSNVIRYFVDTHERYPAYQKVGFGLKIDDLPSHYPLRDSVIEWEQQFWQTELEANIYDSPIDTTFALYKPFTYQYFLAPSLRTGGKYTARHLPWYNNPVSVTPEERYYRRRANADVTSWNVDQLPERYKKEMEVEKKS